MSDPDHSSMSKLPPYAVRRFLMGPAIIVGGLFLLVSMPLWVIGAAFASRFVPGRWRLLRVAWFLFVYLWWELFGLAVLFWLWVIAGFGTRLGSERSLDRHWEFAAWWIDRVMSSARRTFNVSIERSGHERFVNSDRPTIVLCRHAGPGDSFLLIDAVLNRAHRRPRIVLKDLLQFDPCIDVLLNRVPTRFVPSNRRAGELVIEAIGELATDMDGRDALVLFPEGGNFTPKRHARAIVKLREIGRADLSERAERMRHLLPPKPTGALTAIASAPDADVIFVGHVGLEKLSTPADLWRGIPLDSDVEARVWHVDAADVPPPDQREAWLYDQWQEIDDWLEEKLRSVCP